MSPQFLRPPTTHTPTHTRASVYSPPPPRRDNLTPAPSLSSPCPLTRLNWTLIRNSRWRAPFGQRGGRVRNGTPRRSLCPCQLLLKSPFMEPGSRFSERGARLLSTPALLLPEWPTGFNFSQAGVGYRTHHGWGCLCRELRHAAEQVKTSFARL